MMENRAIYAQSAEISYSQNEFFEVSQIPKSIYKDDIYHGAIDLSLIRDECLFEIFENSADVYPTRPAVILQNKEYSYEEIESNANRLARYLRERGIQAGDKVGLILEKSVELYIAMLGIMKAGAAYVPIDSGYPKDRVEYILENSGVSLTVTSSAIASFFGLYDNILLLDQEREIIEKFSGKRLKRTETGVTPNDLSLYNIYFRLYRKAKRSQIEHKSVCNLVELPRRSIKSGLKIGFIKGLQLLLTLLSKKSGWLLGMGQPWFLKLRKCKRQVQIWEVTDEAKSYGSFMCANSSFHDG